MHKKVLIAAALLVACATAAVQAYGYIPADEKRLYPKSANPDGTLNCALGCGNPVTLCC